MEPKIKELLDDVVEVEEYGSEAEWKAARQTGLGASDFGPLLGLSPWKSPLALWADKVGLADSDPQDSERLWWGRRKEPLIRERYTELTGREVLYPGPYVIVRSREFPWLCASLDGITVADGRPGPLEAKTAHFSKRKDWEEEPPLLYQVQVFAQEAVTTWGWGSLAVVLGDDTFLYADLERNQALIDELLVAGERFMHLVKTETPPAPDASESAKEILAKLYPKPEPGKVVVLPAEADKWDEQLVAAKAGIGEFDKQKREAENALRAMIGDAEAGVLSGGVTYTLKQIEKSIAAKDAYTQSYRELRRKIQK